MNKKRTRKPGAGRPPIDQAERKEKVVRVRLTADDLTTLSKLHDLSNHKSLSEVIRRILYREPVRVQIDETGLEQLSNVLYWVSQDLKSLIKSKKATAEAIKEKVADMQNRLSAIEKALQNSKYHSLLMKEIAKKHQE